MVFFMRTTPLVSVIIPCYNAERFVEKAVRSIMEQTYHNLEIICCDDCSSDSTYVILKKLATSDARIKLMKNEVNLGIVRTLNILVKHAHGKYIARMDADDISLPKRIKKQVAYLEKHKDIVVIGCNVIHINEDDRELIKTLLPVSKNEIQRMKIFRTPFYHPAIMARAQLLKENKYDLDFQYAEDYELWLRILENNNCANLRSRLVKYRIHNKQISQIRTLEQINLLKQVYLKYNFGILTKSDIESYALYVAANIKDKDLPKILKKCIWKSKIYKSPLLLLTIIRNFLKARRKDV